MSVRPGGDNQDPTDMRRQAPLAQILRAAANSVAGVIAGRRLQHGLALAVDREGLTGRSRAAVQDIAFETIRRLSWAMAIGDQLNRQRPADELLALQLVALVQLDKTLGAPGLRHPAVIVDQTIRASAAAGVSGFLNATLRRFIRERSALSAFAETRAEVQANLPEWWLERLKVEWPERWQEIVSSQSHAAPLTLRVNRRRARRDELLERWRNEGLQVTALGADGIGLARSLDVTSLSGFAQGLFSVQDAGAQLAAPLLAAEPGQRVLDACAAPGGKTAHLLETVSGLDLLALDSDALRLPRVTENLDRLGLVAQLRVADAGSPEDWWDGRRFDRILIDAPCSASGIVRRHPDIPWLRQRGDIATLSRQQKRLLTALWPLLEPGGKLLYATCSVFRAEGGDIVEGSFVEPLTSNC